MISDAYAATDGHAQASGLPQFDSSVFGSQIFWTIVSFFLLMYLLKRYVIPAINDILDSRGKKISDDLQGAEKARKDAEQVLANYREQLDRARQAAVTTVENARQEAVIYRENALAELNEELAKKKEFALEEIERARKKALVDVRQAAVEMAMLATEKLIVKSVGREEADAMVESALQQMERSKPTLH